jgi:hypothetical protein
MCRFRGSEPVNGLSQRFVFLRLEGRMQPTKEVQEPSGKSVFSSSEKSHILYFYPACQGILYVRDDTTSHQQQQEEKHPLQGKIRLPLGDSEQAKATASPNVRIVTGVGLLRVPVWGPPLVAVFTHRPNSQPFVAPLTTL